MQYFILAIILLNVIGFISAGRERANKRQQRNIETAIRQAKVRKDYWS